MYHSFFIRVDAPAGSRRSRTQTPTLQPPQQNTPTRASAIERPESPPGNPNPQTFNPRPQTLHHTPCTLHPKPETLTPDAPGGGGATQARQVGATLGGGASSPWRGPGGAATAAALSAVWGAGFDFVFCFILVSGLGFFLFLFSFGICGGFFRVFFGFWIYFSFFIFVFEL